MADGLGTRHGRVNLGRAPRNPRNRAPAFWPLSLPLALVLSPESQSSFAECTQSIRLRKRSNFWFAFGGELREAAAMVYVGKHGVDALHRYKYSGIDRSYMAKYVFQPFWRWAVNFFPMWMP